MQFESENKERQDQKEAMFGDVATEKMNLLFVSEDDKTTKEKATAVGKIKDGAKLVTQLLDDYDRGGKRTWHNTIPEDEVWVKVEGDKLTLKIVL